MRKDILIVAHYSGDLNDKSNNRFEYLARLLALHSDVELVTTDFSHTKKSLKKGITEKPFKLTLLHECGYKKNVEPKRFISDYVWGSNLKRYLKKRKKPDLVYCAVPSLYGPFNVAKYCKTNNIRLIIDIQDLWPEAFEMVFNIPVLNGIIFRPFKYLANRIYSSASDIVAVSKTYVKRAEIVNRSCCSKHTVFLGTNIEVFDNYAAGIPMVTKQNDIWLAYCGTLGSSYDLKCVFDALAELKKQGVQPPKFIVMGDGPKKDEFQKYALERSLDVMFTGRLPYDQMCCMLKQCDIVVNPIMHGAAQSIINKHADYAASGLPVISTQENQEYRELVEDYQMGFNCDNNDSKDLADKIGMLVIDKDLRVRLGRNARKCAIEKFDRAHTYNKLVELIESSN